MKFWFKDTVNHTTGELILEKGDTASRDSDSCITGLVRINVAYSVKAWDAVRCALHFEDVHGCRARIKAIHIRDARLIVEGVEVNTI